MRIIPAIDIIDGKCVRLEQGDYALKKVYNHDPLEVAKMFEDNGLEYLHLVDLDGAREGKVINWRTMEKLASKTSLKIDVGGGLKTSDDISLVLDLGIKQVNIGSAAVKQKEKMLQWIDRFGSEQIILSADAKDGKIAIHGWQTITDISLIDFIRFYQSVGINTVCCTDISKDGLLKGPSFALYTQLLEEIPSIQLIASGGVSSMKDIQLLKKAKVYGAIVGKALYEKRIKLSELQSVM